MDFSFVVLGGDSRQYYLARYLRDSGYEVICRGIPGAENARTLRNAVKAGGVIIGPTPFVGFDDLFEIMLPEQLLAGGGIPEEVREKCAAKNIEFYDFMESEDLKSANAILTAEGLLGYIIFETPFSISGSEILVIGCGHCGSAISERLSALGARVTVYDNDPEKTALAKARGLAAVPLNAINEISLEGYRILINTVPRQVLDKSRLPRLKNCAVFDIASRPGGFGDGGEDFRLIKLPGIPGRTAPETAGKIIGENIIAYIRERCQ